MNFNNQEIKESGKVVLHLWDFPDTIYFLIEDNIRKTYFKELYSFYGNKRSAAKHLEVSPTLLRNCEKGFSIKKGIIYPQYTSLKLFKRTIHILDFRFLESLEKNVMAISVRNGLNVKNPILPIVESPKVYSVIAHIIADGTASKRSTPYYANSCKRLRNDFKASLRVFGLCETSEGEVGGTIGVRFPKAITDILSSCFDIVFVHPDRLPKPIFRAPLECKTTFLQALFDDEGTISTGLVVGIHNTKIMKEIKLLLNSIGLKTGHLMIHPYPHKKDKVTLRIPTKEYTKFRDLIGFLHPEKQKNLESAIQTRNRKQRTRNPNYIAERILGILEIKPSKTMELANELLFTLNGITPHLKRMLNEGLIVKRGYKNEIIWDVA